jgi:hypothetical protein
MTEILLWLLMLSGAAILVWGLQSRDRKTITPRLFGNTQVRRRFLKIIAVRMPSESTVWFLYR